MEFLTQKSMHRRTFLRGLSATIALPYLAAMEPAGRFIAKAGGAGEAAKRTRLVCIESVHGAAGSNAWGASKHLWAPQGLGRDFTLNPSGALSSLEPWRKYVNIISNTDVRMAEAFEAPEIGDLDLDLVDAAGGGLAAGVWYYRVAAVMSDGVVVPAVPADANNPGCE